MADRRVGREREARVFLPSPCLPGRWSYQWLHPGLLWTALPALVTLFSPVSGAATPIVISLITPPAQTLIKVPSESQPLVLYDGSGLLSPARNLPEVKRYDHQR